MAVRAESGQLSITHTGRVVGVGKDANAALTALEKPPGRYVKAHVAGLSGHLHDLVVRDEVQL